MGGGVGEMFHQNILETKGSEMLFLKHVVQD